GFLGTLAGLVLGARIGPKLLPAPSPEIWRAAPMLPATPLENSYVTLHQFLGRLIEVVHEETKWLRLERALGDREHSLMGDCLHMRPPMRYKPEIDIDWSKGPNTMICERHVPVVFTERFTTCL